MIALKRRMISVVKALIDALIADSVKVKKEKVVIDAKDENRGTLLHHAFTLWQDD